MIARGSVNGVEQRRGDRTVKAEALPSLLLGATSSRVDADVSDDINLSNRGKLGMDQVFVVWTSKSGLNQPTVV